MPRDLLAAPDLRAPSLEALAWLLRHREAWPVGYRWKFTKTLERDECGSLGCAYGLACLHWGLPEQGWIMLPWHAGEIFHIPHEVAQALFIAGAEVLGPCLVTAEDVAGRIERYLAAGRSSGGGEGGSPYNVAGRYRRELRELGFA